MLNYIWSGIIIISVITSFFTNKIEQIAISAMEGAGNGVTFAVTLLGIMCLWSGLMKICEQSGLVNVFAKILSPVIGIIFPEVPKKSAAMNAIVMNMTANMLGMSNAATPMGLNAMRELARLEPNYNRTATNSMCMLVVINTASIQLIPATVIALRNAADSANPFEIIVPVWICSFCCVVVGVTAAKLFAYGGKKCRL